MIFLIPPHKEEKFYHMLVFGIIQALYSEYFITSNRESGYGRYDTELKENGILKITYIGIAFCGKKILFKQYEAV